MWRKSKTTGRFRNRAKEFLISLSDTQIITAYALLAAGTQIKNNGLMSYYHYNLIADQIWLSLVTHAVSLLCFARRLYDQKYRKKYQIHGWSCMILISGIFAWFFFWSVEGLTYPARGNSEVYKKVGCPTSSGVNSHNITLLIFSVLLAVCTEITFSIQLRRWVDARWTFTKQNAKLPVGWLISAFSTDKKLSVGWLIRALGIQFLLPYAAAIWSMSALCQDRQKFHPEDQDALTEFGQIVPLVLVFGVPVLVWLENLGGKSQTHHTG